MIKEKVSTSSKWMFPSDTELFYTPSEFIGPDSAEIRGEEYHHLNKVMRLAEGDTTYITNGKGMLYKGRLCDFNKDFCRLDIEESFIEENKKRNYVFCLPVLKNADRLEFALEKLIELGYYRFVFFVSRFAVKKNINLERLQKIAIHAMKQSLHSFLPEIVLESGLNKIAQKKNVVVFEQESNRKIIQDEFPMVEDYHFVFGPEGGFSDEEFQLFSSHKKLQLTDQRLRSETAVIYAATILDAAMNK